MGRFSNSWALAKSSWAVLRTDKELAVIPVVSFFVSAAIALLFGGAIYFSLARTNTSIGARTAAAGTALTGPNSTSLSPTPFTYVLGVVAYLCVWFVITYFTAALVAGAHERLMGGNPSLGSAFGKAWDRLPQLAGWSLISGVVGLIIQQIESRGLLGAIVGNILDVAWRLTTWLTIPVIVVEGPGPIDALKRSSTLFKRTWGENMIAQIAFGLIGFLILVPGVVISMFLITVVPVVGVVLLVLWIGVATTITSALNGIFRTALYMYAAGQHVYWFDVAALQGAFRPKHRIFS